MGRALPDVLLPDVLDFLDLGSLLLSAMPVSRFWRTEAVRHPTYWREIQVCEEIMYSVDMFLLRISRSFGRPIRVRISMNDPSPLLEAVAQHLPHIRVLTIIAVVSRGPVIIEALRRSSANVLERLSLNFGFDFSVAIDKQVLAVLPSDLLAAHAPALTFASLINIAFTPSTEFPRCFSNVTHLTVQIGNPDTPISQRCLPNVFERCPDLEVLDLKGNIVLDHPAFREAGLWNSLQALVLYGPLWCSGSPIFRLPIATLPYIMLQDAGVDCIAALAESLGPTLSVVFEWMEDMRPNSRSPASVLLEGMSSPPHGRRRVDVRIPSEPPGIFPYDEFVAFQRAPVVDAVVRLTISLHNWGDLVGRGYLAAFPVLDTLVLTVGQRTCTWVHPAASAKLACPALRQLIVRAQFEAIGMHANLADVAAFAVTALHNAHFPLALRWDGLGVEGSDGDSAGVFKLDALS